MNQDHLIAPALSPEERMRDPRVRQAVAELYNMVELAGNSKNESVHAFGLLIATRIAELLFAPDARLVICRPGDIAHIIGDTRRVRRVYQPDDGSEPNAQA